MARVRILRGLAISLCAALTFAAAVPFTRAVAGEATPTPLADAAPAPAHAPLFTIGHTTSKAPACVVLRDLVAPSLGAALDASEAFANAQTRLAAYGEASAQKFGGGATLMLKRLDPNITAMAKDVHVINVALGDKRVAASVTDPQTRALREALQALYDAENEKLNALNSYVEQQNLNALKGWSEGESQVQNANATGPAKFSVTQPTTAPIVAGPDLTANLKPDYLPGTVAIDTQSPGARDASLEALAAKRMIAAADECR